MSSAPTALSKKLQPSSGDPDYNLHSMQSIRCEFLNTEDSLIESAGEGLDDRLQGSVVRSLSLVPEKELRRAEGIDVLFLHRPRTAAVIRSLGSCHRCKWWSNSVSSNDYMVPKTRRMALDAFYGLRKLRCLPFLPAEGVRKLHVVQGSSCDRFEGS